MLRAFIASITSGLTLFAAETRSGIRLVEAVEADQMRTELVAATGSQAGANEAMRLGIELAKAGIVDIDDVHDMIRVWMLDRLENR